MIITDIKEADIYQVLEIYRPYITDTRITFEYEAPDLETFTERVRHYTEQFPWLVAKDGKKVRGYSYASVYRGRLAYQWDCELSVYVDRDCRGQGIGKRLYTKLLEILTRQGYYNAYGVIALPNENSVRLHENLGFKLEGVQKNSGFKAGKWVDVAFYTKALRTFDTPLKAPVPYPKLLKDHPFK